MERLILWLARGFGVGLIPFAPGTFGSVVGILWFALLLQSASLWIYLGGIVVGFALSVWACGAAEKILKRTDPGSVVLDEIAAVPVCFASFVAVPLVRHGSWVAPQELFTSPGWWNVIAVFVLFRLFDIVKPWPIYQSQKLPAGWGVTVDDFLAGIYTAIFTLPLAW